LRALELGAFIIVGNLKVPLSDHFSPEMRLISQARSIGDRLSGSSTYESAQEYPFRTS
jgi:hypothetical protein